MSTLLFAAGPLLGAMLFAWLGQPGLWLAFTLSFALGAGLFLRQKSPADRSASDGAAIEEGRTLPEALRLTLGNLPNPLLLLDPAGRAVFANSPMERLAGAMPQRARISGVLRMPALLEAVERVCASGAAESVEIALHVPVERRFTAHISRTDGDTPLTMVLLHDRTAVWRAEQARADFVANASHELRTPLATVSGFIDTLRGHARDDSEARAQFLEIMSTEAARMRRLIEDLLSLNRIELNEHVPPSGESDLESVLREAISPLTQLAKKETIALELFAEPNLPPATGARDELTQLFQNLIYNAIKYGHPGGHVWIGLGLAPLPGARDGALMLRVIVRDDGEGIPREAIPRLTERFYRVDVKRSREKGGTGLGLAIVKHIVNRHQGRLVIESEAGRGSQFTVFLPAAGCTHNPESLRDGGDPRIGPAAPSD